MPKRGESGAILKGLLHCAACGGRMVHTHAVKNGARYRYYRCGGAHAQGRRYVPAATLEHYVAERIRAVVEQQADVRHFAEPDDDVRSETAGTARLFDPDWDAAPAQERSSVLRRLLERIDYDVATGDVAIRLQTDAVAILALASIREENE